MVCIFYTLEQFVVNNSLLILHFYSLAKNSFPDNYPQNTKEFHFSLPLHGYLKTLGFERRLFMPYLIVLICRPSRMGHEIP